MVRQEEGKGGAGEVKRCLIVELCGIHKRQSGLNDG